VVETTKPDEISSGRAFMHLTGYWQRTASCSPLQSASRPIPRSCPKV